VLIWRGRAAVRVRLLLVVVVSLCLNQSKIQAVVAENNVVDLFDETQGVLIHDTL
jgi:hypothetical protein